MQRFESKSLYIVTQFRVTKNINRLPVTSHTNLWADFLRWLNGYPLPVKVSVAPTFLIRKGPLEFGISKTIVIDSKNA